MLKVGPGTPGQIDHRLARRSVVSEYRKGRLARHEVCDAHPELIRAARNVGVPSDDGCPICEDAALVHLSYVFGPGMPAQGKLATTLKELKRLGRTGSELACYVVEVCPSCSWNHLTRTFLLGAPRARASSTSRRVPTA